MAALPVNSLVAGRVYWVDRPQSSALPAISMQMVSDERPQHMTGFDGLNMARVQIDCWANSYASVRALAEASLDAVVGAVTSNGIRFERAFTDSIRDLGERTETQFVHRTSLDLIFHHTTA